MPDAYPSPGTRARGTSKDPSRLVLGLCCTRPSLMCRPPRSLEPHGWEAESAQTRARDPTLENKICVLIDFENVAAGTEKEGLGKFDIRAVMRRLKDKGRILVARSYGDWGRFAKFKQQFLEQGITMVEMTSYRGQDKNRADIALVVDAMELAFTRPYIDTFILLSGDSDFTPVVMRLKELDRRVIGMGTRGSTSRLLEALGGLIPNLQQVLDRPPRHLKPPR